MSNKEKVFKAVVDEHDSIIGYEEICGITYSKDPKEGIWLVKKLKNGKMITWVTEFVSELPEMMDYVAFKTYENEVYKQVAHLFKKSISESIVINSDFTASSIMKIIQTVLKKRKK